MSKRQQIIEATLKLLIEKGVHNTPVSAIAKEAGTGMGTIYNYFPDKDTLINEIYVAIKQKEEAIFLSLSSEQPLRLQFEAYYSAIIDFFIDNSSYFSFMEQLQASPIITPESKLVGYKAIEPVTNLLDKGKEALIVKNIPTEELLQFIGGSIGSYLRWYFKEDRKDVRQAYQNQLTMAWDSIKN
ncbi:TetR/AcrR family transcriptional regulator [Cellulophaga sp. Z1A5H]|uniref:TetR/AcrR family transcriptional regulator n=1 Tax=Cellulophaga sp. Z1A5H TaxID=2687291 RepID=UPI0013FDA14F|nr:TetR/AcrR family transcriptional regulator [Cellulophaga sp. Z1A5H]